MRPAGRGHGVTYGQLAERTAANAQAEFQDCLAYSARVDVLQCIESVAETKRASQRAEYDLAAQQEMAYWTPWILLSSVLAATAAYIGVIYLARSNEIVRQSSIQAQRPWVSVNSTIVGPLVFNEDDGRITIRFDLKNFGASPAIGVNVDAKIVASPSRVRFVLDGLRRRAQSFPKKSVLGHKILPNECFAYQISTPVEASELSYARVEVGVPDLDMFPLTLLVCVGYKSALGDENMITEFVADILEADPDRPGLGLAIRVRDRSIEPRNLMLRIGFGSGLAH